MKRSGILQPSTADLSTIWEDQADTIFISHWSTYPSSTFATLTSSLFGIKFSPTPSIFGLYANVTSRSLSIVPPSHKREIPNYLVITIIPLMNMSLQSLRISIINCFLIGSKLSFDSKHSKRKLKIKLKISHSKSPFVV